MSTKLILVLMLVEILLQENKTTATTPANVISIGHADDFKNKVDAADDKLIVIGFVEEYCRKLVQQLFEGQADGYQDVVFLLIDKSKCKRVASDFNIRTVPAYVFQKKQFEFDSCVGISETKLKDEIDRYRTLKPPTNIISVTGDTDYKDRIKNAKDKLVVVCFYDDWLQRMMLTIVQKHAAKYPDVDFLLVNITACGDTVQELRISIVPALVFQKNNFKFKTFVGADGPTLNRLTSQYQKEDPPPNVFRATSVKDFNSRLAQAKNKLIVIDVDSCWYEQPMSQIVQKLAKVYSNAVFILVDKSLFNATAIRPSTGVTTVPAIFLRKNNGPVVNFVGVDENNLNTNIKNHINN